MTFSQLNGKRILVTGATGLIGQALIKKLLTYEGATVFAVVRDRAKADRIFSAYPKGRIQYLICDVRDLKAEDLGIDYVIHGAGFTASRDFVERPVDVITSAVQGMLQVLDFARVNHVKSLAYLSTMEVYGAPQSDEKIYENAASNLDTMCARSSYPESKRLCECLCFAYFAQYGVPTKVIRLTQTFGEGVAYEDKRVFAEFARCAIEGRDIALKTKGRTMRNYLYTEDAVSAILTVLLAGRDGEAYNAANEATYCSIYEMAQMVAQNFGRGKVRVLIQTDADNHAGYAPELKMNLSCEKLRQLGWQPATDLATAFDRMIQSMSAMNR